MNWDQVEGSWKQLRGKVKEQWGRLTDDDLDVIAGRREQLVGTIQKRYGMVRDDVEHEIDEWLERNDVAQEREVSRRKP